jgi:hypothetical protein
MRSSSPSKLTLWTEYSFADFDKADASWFAAHPHFLENERRETEAETGFAASLGLPCMKGEGAAMSDTRELIRNRNFR